MGQNRVRIGLKKTKPVFVAVKRNPSCDIYYKYSDHVDILGLVHMVVYRTERVHEPSSSSLFDNN